jgi:hypothetical protein
MPAPYLLTCPLRSPDLDCRPDGGGGKRGAGQLTAPTASIALKHRLQATAISPICFA